MFVFHVWLRILILRLIFRSVTMAYAIGKITDFESMCMWRRSGCVLRIRLFDKRIDLGWNYVSYSLLLNSRDNVPPATDLQLDNQRIRELSLPEPFTYRVCKS